MNDITVIPFRKALQQSEGYNTKHLLLGNGFSIACDSTIFTYDSLYTEANFSAHKKVKKAFDLMETTDFELMIDALDKASRILPAYRTDSVKLCKEMNQDADAIKELLLKTISTRHPAKPSDIAIDKYDKCRAFLKEFIHTNNKGKIYTLNYDLLLYWTLMHELDDEKSESKFSDGFGRNTWIEGYEPQVSNELTWQGKSPFQNIHYLHGGLHLYDTGGEIQKFSWTDTGVRLIDQSRKALKEGKFPLFVTEGNNLRKMEKINHNSYLFNSFDSFRGVTSGGKAARPGNTCLFTYGVSFSENDKHIFNQIAIGKINKLLISIYGDPKSSINKEIIAKAEAMKSQRDKFPLEIVYYDAASAEVWG
jgi:hypothetical protein